VFELLEKFDATDLVIDGMRSARLLVGGRWQPTDVPFASERAMVEWVRELLDGCGKRFDIASPCADGYVEVGESRYRVHAVLGLTVTSRTQVSVRRHRGEAPTLEGLVANGRITGVVADGIRGVLARRESFLVSGATGAGKTTLLAAALNEVQNERVIVIEDTPELATSLPWVIGLTTRAPNVEGVGAVSATDLVKQTLRMRPDRVTLGEVRGSEIAALAEALASGHPGGGSTIHAGSLASVGSRIQGLTRQAQLAAEIIASLPSLMPWVFHLSQGHGLARFEVGRLSLAASGVIEVQNLAGASV
jgi:pilus assembly protein CpaF